MEDKGWDAIDGYGDDDFEPIVIAFHSIDFFLVEVDEEELLGMEIDASVDDWRDVYTLFARFVEDDEGGRWIMGKACTEEDCDFTAEEEIIIMCIDQDELTEGYKQVVARQNRRLM